MLKTIFKFHNGNKEVWVPANDGKGAAIQSCTLTECVNSGEELTIGSACACALEATLMLVDGDVSITAGDTVTVYKQRDSDTPTQVGVFVLEKPTRTSANTMKITGYDYVSKLDKDLTAWVSGLNGWPYQLSAFAEMVCEACGLSYVGSANVNADFSIYRFSASGVTGRQIMQWLGEISCSFCRATKDGAIEFAWYSDSGVEIKPTGERYYFQNGFTYENYAVTPANMVQLTEVSNTNMQSRARGVPNVYFIVGNAILAAALVQGYKSVVTEALNKICEVLVNFEYTPCTVEIPADLNIHVGDMVTIIDKNGRQISTCVMTKIQSGQKDTLESTGSPRRDSATATNNKTQQEKTAAMENYANVAASSAVAVQSGEEIFNKLTKSGQMEGLFTKKGQLHINASYLATGILQSEDQDTFYLNLDKNVLEMKAKKLSVSGKTVDEIAQEKAGVAAQEMADEMFEKLTNGGIIQGVYAQDDKWNINAEVVKIVNMPADSITNGRLTAIDNASYYDLDSGELVSKTENGTNIVVHKGMIHVYDSAGVKRVSVEKVENDEHYLIGLWDNGGNLVGGLGMLGNDFEIFAYDGQKVAGHPVVWKTINGETCLVAKKEEV